MMRPQFWSVSLPDKGVVAYVFATYREEAMGMAIRFLAHTDYQPQKFAVIPIGRRMPSDFPIPVGHA
jgi:hypothetical protein